MSIKITTWNINSVRLRAPLLEQLQAEHDADVICLQETKTPDQHFPVDACKALGFEHLAYQGQNGYNGVAILSKLPFEKTEALTLCSEKDYAGSQQIHSRHVAVKLLDAGVEIHNFYVPAGGDEPDITTNEKFRFKLDYIAAMQQWLAEHRSDDDKMILVGDLNISPFENDVWSHKQLLNVVCHTPVEVEALTSLREAGGWQDTMREFVALEEKLYTWWSYRNRDWQKSNRGRRLDHIWATKPLHDAAKAMHVLRQARNWTKPSDHVPVTIEFDF